MSTIAGALGKVLAAIAGLWLVYGGVMIRAGDQKAILGSVVLAGVFALPGVLLLSYASTAERRRRAAQIISSRERFSIDEVAAVLRSSAEEAHVFIADQIARGGLELAYQKDTRGYARRGLPPPPPPPPPLAPVSAVTGPCPMCGSTQAPTEAGFCPSCGARAEPPRLRV